MNPMRSHWQIQVKNNKIYYFLRKHSFLGMSIRKLVKDGLIMKKNITIHSRSRARRHLESKRRGLNHNMNKMPFF